MIANILSTELVKCSRCNQYKPQADYYKRSGLSVFYTWCKQCHKNRVAPQVALFDRLDMRINNIERDVIVKLSNMGIFSAPSKRVAGVLGVGCVRYELVQYAPVSLELQAHAAKRRAARVASFGGVQMIQRLAIAWVVG
jgi:hypothetical protein